MKAAQQIQNPKLTAREAGEQFARTAWSEPREIDQWIGNRFQLVNGRNWYQVNPVDGGWEIDVYSIDAD